jgi:prepilin-type N-terminal cleavage/methylation domain-containing protein
MIQRTPFSPASVPAADRAGQRGFTLIEVSISLLVTVIVLLGVLAMFDFSNKLSHVQTNIADMQQSLRVAQTDAVRMIRMAGRGGLPVGTLPNGTAVAVANNVADGTHVGDAGSPELVPGSDMLTIRGVFTSPIYQVDKNNPAAFTLNTPAVPVTGTLHIKNVTPTNIPQDLAAIKDAIAKRRPEALILVSPLDAGVWALVELDPGGSDVSNPNDFKVAFKISGGTHTIDYLKFSSAGPGVFPTNLTSVSFVGIVEEYRYYVRRAYAVTGDKTSDLMPKLARARAYPNTTSPWIQDGTQAPVSTDWQTDLAENVFDLQVSLGVDTLAKGPGACAAGTIAADPINCGIYESTDGENDDWMYNGEKVTSPLVFANSDLYYVRLTTLARTGRRDKDYQAPILVKVEDNKYTGLPIDFNSDKERMYRRRILRTVIDLRNLG